ncbi:uncharacterized protein LOC125238193 [Leguminivora glycinivorella]|uniref:uncharacterized protein LOC125238193 n=1 Tax=Leguminivora glycinivorella TaxID=1035111 RepID=UPI00200D79F8|nr:uncharacterized protein LOC125238193 [Leguminivora glycinivorella]
MSDDVRKSRNVKTYVVKQTKFAICVILGNLMSGYSIGWSAPIAPKLKDPEQSPFSYPISDTEVSWVVTCFILGALPGTNAAGYIANIIGRKSCMLLFSCTHLAGYMIIANAWSYAAVLAGRTLAGLAGALTILNLIYIGEIASPDIRGSLLALTCTFHVLGTLVVYSVGPYVSFKAVCYVCVGLNCAHLTAIFCIPESPVYYLIKGKEEEAKATLLKLGRSEDIDKELRPNTEDADEKLMPPAKHKSETSYWKQLISEKKNRKAFLITTALFCFQVSGGALAVVFFATTIFKNAQSSVDPSVGTIILGLTELCGVMMTPSLIERCGRRVLLLVSTGSCSLAMGLLGTYFYLEVKEVSIISSIRWLPLVLLVICLFAFNIGLGIVPNTLTGEMYSPALRGSGSAISITIAWSLAAILGSSFGYIVAALQNHGVFWLYSAINTAGFLFTAFVVPETRGKTLMEIGYMLEIQYKNPNVQVATLKNLTPSPFIKCYFEDGRQVLIDIDNKSKEDVLEHLLNTVGKSKEVLEAEAVAAEKKDNPANFGVGCERACMLYIGQMIVGISIGWSSAVFQKLLDPDDSPISTHITPSLMSLISSLPYIGSIIGSYITGYLSNIIGRKPCLLFGGIITALSFILVICTRNLAMIYALRIIQGFGIGIITVGNIVYIGEIASKNIRGILLTVLGIASNLGTQIIILVGPFVSYAVTGWLGLGLTIIFVGSMLRIPESPIFYLIKDKEDEAKQIFIDLGRDQEFKEYLASKVEEKEHKNGAACKELFTIKSNRKALFIILMLVIFRAMTGTVATMFFAISIFELAGLLVTPHVSIIIIQFTQLGSSCLTPFFVEWSGRKTLLLLSTAVCGMSVAVLGTYFYFSGIGYALENVGWLPLFAVILYFMFYGLGFGIIPETLTGEMFSANVRSAGAAVTITTSWIVGFVVSSLFGYMMASGAHSIFWMFTAACACACLFTARCVPETKGKSLLEIQQMME